MDSNKAAGNQHSFQVGDTVRLKEGVFGTVEHIDRMHKDSIGVRVGGARIYRVPDEVVKADDGPQPKTTAYLEASACLDSTLTQIRQGYDLSIKDTIKLLSEAVISLTEELE